MVFLSSARHGIERFDFMRQSPFSLSRSVPKKGIRIIPKTNTPHPPTPPSFPPTAFSGFYFTTQTPYPNERVSHSREGHPRKGEGLEPTEVAPFRNRRMDPGDEISTPRSQIGTSTHRHPKRLGECQIGRISRRDLIGWATSRNKKVEMVSFSTERTGSGLVLISPHERERVLAWFKEGKHAAPEHTNTSWPVCTFRNLGFYPLPTFGGQNSFPSLLPSRIIAWKAGYPLMGLTTDTDGRAWLRNGLVHKVIFWRDGWISCLSCSQTRRKVLDGHRERGSKGDNS